MPMDGRWMASALRWAGTGRGTCCCWSGVSRAGGVLLSVVESRLGPAGLFSRSCVLLFCSVQRCSALVSCCCHLFSSVQRPAVLFCMRPSCCSVQRRSPSSLFSRSCACTGNSASVLQSIHWSVRSHAG